MGVWPHDPWNTCLPKKYSHSLTMDDHFSTNDHLTLFILVGFVVCSVYFPVLAGFYETRIAYYSWCGAKRYHFSFIPAY